MFNRGDIAGTISVRARSDLGGWHPCLPEKIADFGGPAPLFARNNCPKIVSLLLALTRIIWNWGACRPPPCPLMPYAYGWNLSFHSKPMCNLQKSRNLSSTHYAFNPFNATDVYIHPWQPWVYIYIL